MTTKPNQTGAGAAQARPWVGGEELRRRIARKAHELFEKRGAAHGRDREDWLEAERLVHLELEAELRVQPEADVTRRDIRTPPGTPKSATRARRDNTRSRS